MWLFKKKFNAYASLSCYNSLIVPNRHSHQERIDFDETFSLVIKPDTIHIVFSLVISIQWPIHQLNVKNSFLHGCLQETIFMHQPPGFQDSYHSDYVCHIYRSLYNLKKPCGPGISYSLNMHFGMGFQHIRMNLSLFTYHQETETAYLLLYIDNIVFMESSLLCPIIAQLSNEFTMTNLRNLNYFLGISFTRTSQGLFLS